MALGAKRPESAESVTTTQRPGKASAAEGASTELGGSVSDEDDEDMSDGGSPPLSCCLYSDLTTQTCR